MSKLATRKKLGELCSVVTKGTTPTSLGMKFEDEGVPFLRIQNLSGSSVHLKDILYISEDTHNALNRSKIMPGDFLITIAGTIGRVAIVPDDFPEANCNQAVAILRFDKSKLLPRYLLHWLTTNDALRQISGKKVTATISNLSLGQIKELEIPLPPLDEQKRIAAILDKADAIRRKRQQAINLADDFLRSVFLDMFGDPVTNPKSWQVELLGEHIRHANNGLSRRRKVEENIGDIVLRLQDVHYEGIRFGKELNRVDLEDKEKSRYRLDIGDLLFIRVNGNPEYVGRSAVFEGFNEAVFHNDHLIRIKVKDSFNSRFLSYMLNLPGGKKIISSKTKTSAGQHTISQGGIESLEFIIPPIDLQNKFVEIQSKVKMQLTRQSVSFNELTHSFDSLSQKAFAGEL